jgi:hypothetical protein
MGFNNLTVPSIMELFFWDVMPCGWANSTNVLEKPAALRKLQLKMLYTRNSLLKPI